MNKTIKAIVILVNYISLFFFCVSYASETEVKKQKRKALPKMVIAEIPPFEINKQSPSCRKRLTLLDICKADDTIAFEKLYQEIKTEGIKYNSAYAEKDNEDNMPLHIACSNNNVRMVEILTPHTYEINSLNSKKETPLHIACRSRKKAKVEMVKLLCKKRMIDCSIQDESTLTALHIACMHKDAALTKIILATKHAEKCLPLQTKEGSTPLNIACMFKNIESVQLLLARKYTYSDKAQFDGSTPLHNAVLLRCYEIMKLLLADQTTNLNQQDTISNTPLHLACEKNDVAAVTLLLMHKTIDPYIENGNELKPLHIAQQFKSRDIKQQRYNQTIIKLFQDYEAQLKALNKEL